MRVAIDLLAVRSWGMKNYTTGFLPALASLSPSSRFLVFLRPEIAELVRELIPANVEIRVVPLGVAGRLIWEQTVMPLLLLRWRADVLFAAFDVAPLLSPCPVLLAVRNPSPVLISARQSLGQSLKARLHQAVSFVSCWRSRLVFYPTAFAADVLGTSMRLSESKRRVVNHGTDVDYFTPSREAASTLTTYHLRPHQYILYVSGFYPYKHPEVLIDAFAAFSADPAHAHYKLVLVGADLLIAQTKRVAEQRLRKQVRDLGLEDRVVFVGQVTREHLVVLYQGATAFALPTVMETFGLVFVEAMASGTPVVCADMPFAREICGDAALYFPPGDRAALTSALREVALDATRARAMTQAGRERARMFSWHREARETLDLLTQVADARAAVPS